MKIAVIGGGLTGLTAAYELTKAGHNVTVFEKESALGGLAGGFRRKGWDWYLEKSYHHFFTNDVSILRLLSDVGLGNKIIIKRPITATLMPNAETGDGGEGSRDEVHFGTKKENMEEGVQFRERIEPRNGKRRRQDPLRATSAPAIFQLDSPMNLLTFPYLSPIDKFRTAALLTFLKLNPFWQPLENITAQQFFKTIGGSRAWEVIWEPLMRGKFGDFAPNIAASWLWARVKKRTPRLCYIDGGFQTLVDALAKTIKKNGGTILINTQLVKLDQLVKFGDFDKILLTVPTAIAAKLTRFPASYIQPLLKIPHLHAQTLILETKKPILDTTYWLNVNDRSFPFLAAVAHTNFMNSKHYGNHHLTYFGNYLPAGHPYLSLSAKELLEIFQPFIQKLNPSFNFKFQILNFKLFVAPFAQPVHELHYSKRAPKIQTPIPNVYLANLDSIYPWDRGTNYAVELGMKAAHKIECDSGAGS